MKSFVWLACAFFLMTTGCASSALKQRKEQRDRAAQTSKMFCEFVNGDIYPDIEVALNLEMAKRCDPDKNFTVTEYKTRSEVQGVIFCCSLTSAGRASVGNSDKSETPPPPPKKEVKKAEAKAPAAPAAKVEDDELD